jgi:hypothetical protein
MHGQQNIKFLKRKFVSDLLRKIWCPNSSNCRDQSLLWDEENYTFLKVHGYLPLDKA